MRLEDFNLYSNIEICGKFWLPEEPQFVYNGVLILKVGEPPFLCLFFAQDRSQEIGQIVRPLNETLCFFGESISGRKVTLFKMQYLGNGSHPDYPVNSFETETFSYQNGYVALGKM